MLLTDTCFLNGAIWGAVDFLANIALKLLGSDQEERGILKAVLKNENFCLSTRQAKIITAGIYFIF